MNVKCDKKHFMEIIHNSRCDKEIINRRILSKYIFGMFTFVLYLLYVENTKEFITFRSPLMKQ